MGVSSEQEGRHTSGQTERIERTVQKLSVFKERFDPVLFGFFTQEIQEARDVRPEIAEFVEIGAEFVLRGGKRLRPTFVFEGYKAVEGRNEEEVLSPAISVELFHAAAMVHDDIIDNSDLRRGKPTVHRIIGQRFGDESLGKSLAIVVGDTLVALANKTASSLNENSLARYYFDQMCIEINKGQYLDILGNRITDVDRDWVMKLMEYKTARYTVEKPLLIGAALGGGNEEDLNSLSRYALPLGIAFQIQDDILGMFGEEEKVGKPVDSDLKEGKKTLLILETIQRLKESERELDLKRLEEILGNPDLSKADYRLVQELMVETDALGGVKQAAYDLVLQAKRALEDAQGISDDSKDYLLGMADFMLAREN